MVATRTYPTLAVTVGDRAIDLMLRRRAKQAGIESMHAHLLRHGFAPAWLATGGQEGDLMMPAGWKSRDDSSYHRLRTSRLRIAICRPLPGHLVFAYFAPRRRRQGASKSFRADEPGCHYGQFAESGDCRLSSRWRR